MSHSKKFYVVWEGKVPGVYDNWPACEQQVHQYTHPKYKSFPSRAEAEYAYNHPEEFLSSPKKKSPGTKKVFSGQQPISDSISVDAACSGNPGLVEYRGVHTTTKEPFFAKGPYHDGTNNIGEFLALVHCLALQKRHKLNLPIYTDSMTAMKWVKDKKAKTKLERTSRNTELFELIERAEQWLKENPPFVPIIKWDTDNWGEIPADYGRK